jgi:CCR4-NOT transcriptional complex subunit CAF120
MADYFAGGRPSTDRAWTECFAQLVGTVLSLWDAAALDAAGADGEVLPTFINVSDASIKMVSRIITSTSKRSKSLTIRRRSSRFQ